MPTAVHVHGRHPDSRDAWSSDGYFVGGKVSPATAKTMTITLPRAITVSEIAVDPSNTCGDGGSASLGGYTVETSSDGTTFTTVHEGRFTIADRGQLNAVPLDAGTANVTFVRFTMKDPQVFDAEVGGPNACPGAFSGCDFMDLTEIEVYGS